MHLQVLLMIFSLNVYKAATKSEGSGHAFQFVKKTTDGGDIDDTPSPEWIEYQKERYIERTYRPTAKSNPIPTTVTHTTATRSRQGSAYKEDIQQVDIENNNNAKYSQESPANKVAPVIEFPSIRGFIEFIKSLKRNWMNISLFGIDDKIKMLQHLKDSLLKTIEQQFMILWQDDEDDVANEFGDTRKMTANNQGARFRSKRGILDESSINFPPDVALMSINFLTFAVFLIKLVLQVVNIIKSKHYQLSTFNMETDEIRNG